MQRRNFLSAIPAIFAGAPVLLSNDKDSSCQSIKKEATANDNKYRHKSLLIITTDYPNFHDYIVDSFDSSVDEIWNKCPMADWMLWLLAKTKTDRKQIVLCACEIARDTLPLIPSGEDRPRIAIETAEAWCRGEATIEEVKAAAYATYAATYAAYYAYAAAKAYGSRETEKLAEYADIVRKHFPLCPV